MVNLIGSTRTQAGLKVQARLDRGTYPTGVKVSDEQLAAVALMPSTFRGEWNYTISPRRNKAIVS